MKFALSFFSILALIITGTLFFQYQAYSSNLEAGNGEFYYSQEIEIVYRENSLDIRQHFKNLPNQKVNIKWPEKVKDATCFIDNKNSCSRLSDEMTYFNAGETKAQSVSYIIPIQDGLQDKQYLQDVFATLQNGEASYSVVHISTDSKMKGQWVTGLPLIGQQQLSLVNYTMFSGTGAVHDLYWQAGDIQVQKQTPVLSIYANQAISNEILTSIESIQFVNDEHISIIQEKSPVAASNERILFLPELTKEAVEQQVILSQVKSKISFQDAPDWLVEVVATYFVDHSLGSEKAKNIVEVLKEAMSVEQKRAWQEAVTGLGEEPVTPTKMDTLLSEVFAKKTSYFERNVAYKDRVYPLLFEDGRKVYIDEIVQEDVNIILFEGQTLYTADTLLPHLGYQVSEGENGYYVKSETRTFRFPKESGFYVFNQRRYSTISEPISKIADQYYIEEAWLQRLFFVELQKSDHRINVTTEVQS